MAGVPVHSCRPACLRLRGRFVFLRKNLKIERRHLRKGAAVVFSGCGDWVRVFCCQWGSSVSCRRSGRWIPRRRPGGGVGCGAGAFGPRESVFRGERERAKVRVGTACASPEDATRAVGFGCGADRAVSYGVTVSGFGRAGRTCCPGGADRGGYSRLRARRITSSTLAEGDSLAMARTALSEAAFPKPSIVRAATASS